MLEGEVVPFLWNGYGTGVLDHCTHSIEREQLEIENCLFGVVSNMDKKSKPSHVQVHNS